MSNQLVAASTLGKRGRIPKGLLVAITVLHSCSSPDNTTVTTRSDLEDRWDRPECPVPSPSAVPISGTYNTTTERAPCVIALRGTGVQLDISTVDPVMPIVRLSTGELAAVTSGRDQLAVWSETGELIRLFGQRGEGPGEFRRAVTVFRDRFDTLYVFDAVSHMEVIDPRRGYVRTVTGLVPYGQESAAIMDDGRFLIARPNRVPNDDVFAVIDKDIGEAVTTFGGNSSEVSTAREQRLVAYSGGATFWAAAPHRYTLELWDTSGVHLASIERHPYWFENRDQAEAGPANTEVSIIGIDLDENATLWVTILVPPDNAPLPSPTPDPASASATKYQLRVEAFDTRSAELLASELLANPYDFFPGTLGDSKAYRVRFDNDGIMHVELVSYQLVQR